jgi:hypothetical protein
VRYAYFDLHAKCGNKNYAELHDFIEHKLGKAVAYCSFTALRIDRE